MTVTTATTSRLGEQIVPAQSAEPGEWTNVHRAVGAISYWAFDATTHDDSQRLAHIRGLLAAYAPHLDGALWNLEQKTAPGTSTRKIKTLRPITTPIAQIKNEPLPMGEWSYPDPDHAPF